MAKENSKLALYQTAPFAIVMVIALTAFYLTSEEVSPLFAAIAVAASELVRVRLPRSRLLAASLRLAIFTPILIHLGIPADTFPQWYLKPSYTILVGCLLSAEAAIRAWEPTGGLLSGDQRGVMFFVSGLIIAAAANTNERNPMSCIAPTYVIFALLALRSFDARPWRLSLLQAVRLGMIAVVLLGGFKLASAVTHYDDALNVLVERYFFQRRQHSQIGLSSSPRLTAVFNPIQTMDRILLVEGSLSQRYLAAAEFDHYQNPVWSPDVNSRPFISADPRELRTNAVGTKLTFTRIGMDLNLLPLPLNSISVESVAGVERDEFGALRHTEQGLTGSSSLCSAIVADSDVAQGPLTSPLLDSQRKAALQLVDGFDAKAVDLSLQLTRGSHDQAAVLRLANHLRSTHGYSLFYRPEGVEPISAFILHNSAAHCEYFASALVMLCRASGIPARLVTGYYAYEPFSGNTLVVRGRDAHAWAEAWIEGAGWISVDATPSGGRPDSLNQPSSWFRRTWERVSDWPGYLRDWLSKLSTEVLIIIVCAVAGGLLLVFVLRVAWQKWVERQKAIENAYAARDRRLTRAAQQFDRWLTKSGFRCTASQSWRDCLRQVPQAERFIDAYDRARFGPPDPPAVEDALNELRRLRLLQLNHRQSSAVRSATKEDDLGR